MRPKLRTISVSEYFLVHILCKYNPMYFLYKFKFIIQEFPRVLFQNALGNSQPLKILPFQSALFFLYLHFSVFFSFLYLSENFQIPIDKPASLCGRLNCPLAIKTALRLRKHTLLTTIEGGHTYDKKLAVPSGIPSFPA